MVITLIYGKIFVSNTSITDSVYPDKRTWNWFNAKASDFIDENKN